MKTSIKKEVAKGFFAFMLMILLTVITLVVLGLAIQLPLYIIQDLLHLSISDFLLFIILIGGMIGGIYILIMLLNPFLEHSTYQNFLEYMYEGESLKYHGLTCFVVSVFSCSLAYFFIDKIGITSEVISLVIGIAFSLAIYALFVSTEMHQRNRNNSHDVLKDI